MICIDEPHYAIAIAIAQTNGCCSNIIVLSEQRLHWSLFRSQSCCPIKRDYLGILLKCRNPLPPFGNPCFQKKYYGLFCILGPWELSARDHNVARMDHLCHKLCLKARAVTQRFSDVRAEFPETQPPAFQAPASASMLSGIFMSGGKWKSDVWRQSRVSRNPAASISRLSAAASMSGGKFMPGGKWK